MSSPSIKLAYGGDNAAMVGASAYTAARSTVPFCTSVNNAAPAIGTFKVVLLVLHYISPTVCNFQHITMTLSIMTYVVSHPLISQTNTTYTPHAVAFLNLIIKQPLDSQYVVLKQQQQGNSSVSSLKGNESSDDGVMEVKTHIG